jgi:hypothetical protein
MISRDAAAAGLECRQQQEATATPAGKSLTVGNASNSRDASKSSRNRRDASDIVDPARAGTQYD